MLIDSDTIGVRHEGIPAISVSDCCRPWRPVGQSLRSPGVSPSGLYRRKRTPAGSLTRLRALQGSGAVAATVLLRAAPVLVLEPTPTTGARRPDR
jgi:hypothetical protein